MGLGKMASAGWEDSQAGYQRSRLVRRKEPANRLKVHRRGQSERVRAIC